MKRTTRIRSVIATVALLLSLAACGDDGFGPSDDARTLLPTDSSGLVFLDCWSDTASVVDLATGQPGPAFGQHAEPVDSEVQVQSMCQEYFRADLSGITSLSPDRTTLAATKRSPDGAEHVGYIDVRSGIFTDISERLKLDANGRYTDEGSGLDDFAGPIKDRVIGFSAAGDFYLERADTVHAAVGPDYVEFVKQPAGDVLGDTATGAITQVSAGDQAPLLQVPAGTPTIEPLDGADAAEGKDADFAPLQFAADDDLGQSLRCDDVRWVDETHLLCQGYSETPWIIDLTAVALVPAVDFAEDGQYCSDCRGWQYVWSVPVGAAWPLVPETSRELKSFIPVSSAGLVYFLADNGDSVILYSISTNIGATPTKLSTFAPGESPSFSYLALQWR